MEKKERGSTVIRIFGMPTKSKAGLLCKSHAMKAFLPFLRLQRQSYHQPLLPWSEDISKYHDVQGSMAKENH